MTPNAIIVKATAEHAEYLAPRLRDQDVAEIWAASRVQPHEALMEALGGEAFTGIVDDEPACMFGCRPVSPLHPQVAIPWLLGTEKMVSRPWTFLRVSHIYVRNLKERHQLLYNYVDARNTVAVQWIRSLGFVLQPAQPYGYDRLPFHRFYAGIDDV